MRWMAMGLVDQARHVIERRLTQETRVIDALNDCEGLVDHARHVKEHQLTQDTRVQNALDDVAGNGPGR